MFDLVPNAVQREYRRRPREDRAISRPPASRMATVSSTPLAQAVVSEEEITALLAFWGARLSNENTRRSYWAGLRDFAAFIKERSPVDATSRLLSSGRRAARFVLEGWKSSLYVERKLAPGTCNSRFAAIRSLLEAARDLDLIEWDVKIKDFKVQTFRDTRGPGIEVFRRMFRFIQEDTINPYSRARDVAILRLLFDLGLRANEACNLELQHVDLVARSIEVLGKGDLERIRLTLPKPTVEALRDWVCVRGTWPGPLFVSVSNNNSSGGIDRQTIYRLIRRAGEGVGVKTHPHAIRHLAITTLANADEPLLSVQQFARHANPATTIRYIDNARDIGGKAAEKLATFLISDGKTLATSGKTDDVSGAEQAGGLATVPRWRSPLEMQQVNTILRRAVEEAGGCARLIDVSGVSRASLYAWMAGRRNLSNQCLENLAAYLGVKLPSVVPDEEASGGRTTGAGWQKNG